MSDKYKVYKIEIGWAKSHNMLVDAKRYAFDASRYKFCSKMLAGKKVLLEVGCCEGLWIPIVSQVVDKIVAIDIDEEVIEDNKKRLFMFENIEFRCVDFLKGVDEVFDGIYSLDVLEHIEKVNEKLFFDNIARSLSVDGVCIIGTPNITGEQYASERSKDFHVNLKTHDELKSLMNDKFRNVFMFGMNDEIVHTGFFPMCQYILAMGVGIK